MAARRNAKACEFCEADSFYGEDLPNCQLAIEVYPDNCHIAVFAFGKSDDNEQTSEQSYTIPMDWCPCCGRRLGW